MDRETTRKRTQDAEVTDREARIEQQKARFDATQSEIDQRNKEIVAELKRRGRIVHVEQR